MDRTIYLILVTFLVSFCSSAILPDEYLSHVNTQEGSSDEELHLEARGRCPGRRNRRLPTSMIVDTSFIDTSYLDSLVEMEDVHTRSLSPWDYRLNTDPNRFPFVISEADCVTFACVDADGNENPDLISSPVKQEMMVLRREQKSCSFSYRLETVVVTVGCTCVRPMVSYY
ncbi:interleukin-17A-like [Hyla sarda]|uniref:interleukin-17A-like n=1 Tax=Hyla sarda TaxID=327740 RepID=UPI0024C2A516|nr:interleukin-17A-like [Hyla sarda]XP_056419996.1 interleukin-17A-like [Hyla sarda]